ncbi:type III-B CRISPR module RAMP protein Cmr1 [Pseudodesulfovibrio sp.]|uniref:type III-B CRISPR module RAMP protein Cmr1 n=1 Tax=unclassified Pseudodesulfovibrio TaxID=2661612 RepID=UPI003B006233
MKKGSVLNAKYRIVTPMFCAGAQQDCAELKATSFLGALGFWWRALAWHQLDHSPGVSESERMKDLRNRESKIFGSAADGVRAFLPTIEYSSLRTTSKLSVTGKPGAQYLAYGATRRPYINENQTFTLKLRFRREVDDSIVAALKLLGLLGGLGSRSRKGYGSLTLEELKHDGKIIWDRPTSYQELKNELQGLLGSTLSCAGLPLYSAFSARARVDHLEDDADPLVLLDFVGLAMLRYRSAGVSGIVQGRKSERNFELDHDWCKDPARCPVDFHPERVVFGLPHKYYDRETETKPSCKPEKNDRRASPLIFHIHEFGSGNYCALSTLLESDFLPREEKINAAGKLVPQKAEYKIIRDFLTHSGTDVKPAYFPNRVPILP